MVEQGHTPPPDRRRIHTMVMSLAAKGQRAVKVFARFTRLQRRTTALSG
jgi:hypothetical protein